MILIKRHEWALSFIFFLVALLGIWVTGRVNAQSGGGVITGYAWSDTIGWISLSGSGYGFSVAVNGQLSGYAWSDTVGWISANAADLTGCPISPCTANIQGSSFTGWLKVLSAGSSQSGGWDGWIRLSGSSPSYGVIKNPNGTFTGYAWGDIVVGWVNFSYAQTTYSICSSTTAYTCTGTGNNTIRRTDTDAYCQATVTDGSVCLAPEFCSVGSASCLYDPIVVIPTPDPDPKKDFTGHLEVHPILVPVDDPVTIYWNVDNVSTCDVNGTNGQSWSSASSGASGQVTNPIDQSTTFTMVCHGGGGSSTTESVTVNIVPKYLEN